MIENIAFMLVGFNLCLYFVYLPSKIRYEQ